MDTVIGFIFAGINIIIHLPNLLLVLFLTTAWSFSQAQKTYTLIQLKLKVNETRSPDCLAISKAWLHYTVQWGLDCIEPNRTDISAWIGKTGFGRTKI
jgi:hypothetical protein